MKSFVIATLKEVVDPKGFYEVVTTLYPEVKGILLTQGPGCTNIGVTTGSEESVKALTMALMPARYTKVTDGPWEGLVDER